MQPNESTLYVLAGGCVIAGLVLLAMGGGGAAAVTFISAVLIFILASAQEAQNKMTRKQREIDRLEHENRSLKKEIEETPAGGVNEADREGTNKQTPKRGI